MAGLVNLGKRKLTYKIGKSSEGIYLQLRLQLIPKEVAGLKKAVSMMESVLRFLIVHQSAQPVAAATAPLLADEERVEGYNG